MVSHFDSGTKTQAITPLLVIVSVMLWVTLLAGCSTLSSLGLPVASGPYKMLSTASKIRNETGHPDDVPHEMSKSVQAPHRAEPGDVLVFEPADFDSLSK